MIINKIYENQNPLSL